MGRKREKVMAAAIVQLDEALTDLQQLMVAEEKGWDLVGDDKLEPAPKIRRARTVEARLAIAANPLIKRGVNLNIAYIWGQGVTVTIRDEASTGQDIQQVLTEFMDDPMNEPLWSLEGQIDRENELAATGEVWLALPTTPRGRVRVRPLDAGEITTIITDPEDRFTDWFYLREYTLNKKTMRVLYPALGYRPAVRPELLDHDAAVYIDRPELANTQIRWDSPVRKVLVNKLGRRGTGDVFAALPPAEAYRQFLGAWHKIMMSLARYVWRAKTKGDKAQQVAEKILANEGSIGRTTISDGTTGVEAINKTGATFDADSGRPLAGMVAAALGLPITMLLTDPGVTGARATAETLDEPTQLDKSVRRKIWTRVFQDVVGYVIDAKVRAGALRGTITRDGDREIVTLPEGDKRTVVVDWPPFDSTPVETLVKAIVEAQSTMVLDDLTILRLLLKALEVEDADELLTAATDAQGRFIPLDMRDMAARQAAEDRGGQ